MLKQFILLAIANFLFFLGNSIFLLLNIYVAQIGGSKIYIGIIMGLPNAVLVLMMWIYRNKIDYLNKRKYLILASII